MTDPTQRERVPFGQPPGLGWAPPAPHPAPRDAVPGTVQAAAIVTWVCCALAALATAFLTVAAVFMGWLILPYFERTDRVEIVTWVAGAAALSLAACAIASTCAWFVWRRHRWARVVLALCGALTLLASIVLVSPASVVPLPGAVAVLVLLFLPASNAWFRSSGRG